MLFPERCSTSLTHFFQLHEGCLFPRKTAATGHQLSICTAAGVASSSVNWRARWAWGEPPGAWGRQKKRKPQEQIDSCSGKQSEEKFRKIGFACLFRHVLPSKKSVSHKDKQVGLIRVSDAVRVPCLCQESRLLSDSSSGAGSSQRGAATS